MKDKCFSVSLVFTKEGSGRISHALRAIVLYAKNKDEALGAAIRLIEPEFKEDGWLMYLKCVLDVTGFKIESEK